jgi:hypothetical protein
VTRGIAVILALGALAVAAVFVSIASWVLLWRERRERRTGGSPGHGRVSSVQAKADREQP